MAIIVMAGPWLNELPGFPVPAPYMDTCVSLYLGIEPHTPTGILSLSDRSGSQSLEFSIMHTAPSFRALALVLSLFTLTEGWGLRRKPVEHAQEDVKTYPVYRPRGAGIFEKRQGQLVCPNDDYQKFLDSNPPDAVATFCNSWLGIPPATTVVEYIPTV
jgi:hypothetical protein